LLRGRRGCGERVHCSDGETDQGATALELAIHGVTPRRTMMKVAWWLASRPTPTLIRGQEMTAFKFHGFPVPNFGHPAPWRIAVRRGTRLGKELCFS
jgi:hypothetical protein